MGSPLQFWENLAPYLSHIEDNFLDLESINKLKSIINDPVLIIGAGQGLLVESLQQCGYKVDGIDNNTQMIEYAERRRGIKLIQEDATKLSFDDNSYRTTIIATGVIDYIGDSQLIEKILNEAVRVTTDDGRILVAFYRMHPASEAFQKCAALATKAGVEGKEISIRSPLEGMRKAEIIQRGLELKVDYSLTRSCYDPSPEGLSCGKCDSCILRGEARALQPRAGPV